MNQYAKQRAQAGLRGLRDEPADDAAAAPLAGPPAEPPSAGPHDFVVAAEHAGERLDRYLAQVAPGLSRTRLKSLIEAGQVAIDGKFATAAVTKVRAGQSVVVNVPPPIPAEPSPEAIPLQVVYEDDALIVIDKPAGLVVHPAAGHESGTLVNALIAHCGESLSGIGGVRRPGIVHRLDKDTSGLLVVAKTDAAHQGLAALFADHGRNLPLTRDYLAFVWGGLERTHGSVEAALGRHPWHREKQAVVPSERGREAVTHFQVEETFGKDKDGRPLVSLVRCSLETGRTHQIRVHMAHIGHPLLGDALYGSGFKTKSALLPQRARDLVEALHRQALHATSLGFEHPVTGEELSFESPLPAELRALREALAEA